VEIRTTAKADGVCNIVNDTMQDQQQKNRNDDEIQHDNEAPHVCVDVMYSTEYNKCHGRQRWQVKKSNNG
jgi:hypothetical protein